MGRTKGKDGNGASVPLRILRIYKKKIKKRKNRMNFQVGCGKISR